MRQTFVLIGFIGIATFVCAENFIVKKTKQMVVSYSDQWCDLFGQVLQLCADLDMQKSILQKKGINNIVCAMQSGNDVQIAQLPKAEQQDMVQQLQKLIDQMQKTISVYETCNKKLEAISMNDKKVKK